MAAPSKSQLLDKIYTLLAKRYKLEPRDGRMSVLEAVLYGICHEGTTREQANQAMSRFKDEFFDWNEVRVSPISEIQSALIGLPDPEAKAHRIRKFLRQMFERTYTFELDHLTKKPLKESIKALQEFEAGTSDFVLGTTIQRALGGHALPIDEPTHRALVRLGVAEPDTTTDSLRSALERAVPKSRGVEFIDLLEELAHDTCVAGEPDCPQCALVKLCPTGRDRISSRSAPSPPTEAKPSSTSSARGSRSSSRGRTPRPK